MLGRHAFAIRSLTPSTAEDSLALTTCAEMVEAASVGTSIVLMPHVVCPRVYEVFWIRHPALVVVCDFE